MSDKYDGEVSTPKTGKRDFERDTARGKALREDFLNSTHSTRCPEIDMIFQDGSHVNIPQEYQGRNLGTRSLYEGIRHDWETNSPISPAPHSYSPVGEIDSSKLFGLMSEITRIRDRVGRSKTKIDSAKIASQVFKSVRAETQVHPNDLFDDDWETYEQILEGYPFARYRLNIDMEDGLDQHKRLISFTHGEVTVFADDNNYFAQNSNIFWYQNGLLMLGSTLDTSKGEAINDDVLVFADENEIDNTDFHRVNSAFYDALHKQGRHFETDMTMMHLRHLYEDNNVSSLGNRLKASAPMTELSSGSSAERLTMNLLIKKTLDDFVKTQNKRLITDSDFEEYLKEGITQIQRDLVRGNKPLYKLE